jgi:hypothetical protein
MGSIRRTVRPLTTAERDWLLERPQPIAAALEAANAVEFQLTIDRVLKPPPPAGMPSDQELYLLEIGPSQALGFEYCFMNGALVDGSFPSQRVQIAFAESRLNESAVSFSWSGQQLAIQPVADSPPVNTMLLSVFRGDWLDEAIAPFA